MDVPHPLQSILQLYLASDASAILYSQQVLEQLSSSCFTPSSHLQKWCTRVTSLMHSRDPGARWAGICFAYRTSSLSELLLVEHAKTWIGIVLPLLSKPEAKPTLKVSIRYLRLVLSVAMNHPEFQRQIAAPAVPKICAAMTLITESLVDTDTTTLAIQTLSQLVTLYPSQLKASSSKLFTLCHRVFSGSSPQETDGHLLDATTELFSVLHYLAGKAGGASAWRSCLDNLLQSSWVAWAALRTTFPKSATYSSGNSPSNTENTTPYFGPLPGDPVIASANCLDRLRCNITAICALLRAPAQRPVRVPIGLLAVFGYTLMICTDEEQDEQFDPQIRALEIAAVPQLWMRGYQLLSCLSQTTQNLMAPSLSRLIVAIACRLEESQQAPQRVILLRTAYDLLRHCPVVGAQLAVTRLMKAIITPLSSLCLPCSTQGQESATPTHTQSKASQKRRRDFQADNALSTRQPPVCATTDECHAVLASLDVVREILKNVELPPSVCPPASRVLMTLLLSLPSTPPQSLSYDTRFFSQLVGKVRGICLENVSGTYVMDKSVGLVLRSCVRAGGHEDPSSRANLQSCVDLLIHPRRPPLTRTLPFVSLTTEVTRDETATPRDLDVSQRIEGTEQSYPKGPGPIKAPEPFRVPSQVDEPQEHLPSPQPSKRQTNMSPPRLSDSIAHSIAHSDDLPMKPNTPSQPIPPPKVHHLPAAQSQLQAPKLVDLTPVMFVAEDDDYEGLPTIDMESDSDA
ncbi:rRNA processing/ribosome biogenesis-domain-containing protein [Scleroderma citrinum]